MKVKVKGLTILELVVVMVIVGILAVGFSRFIIQSVDLWDFLSSRNEIVNQARTGLARMGREIRQLGALTLSPFVETSSSTVFRFIKLEGSNEVRIEYEFSGNQLSYKRDESPPQTFVSFDSSNVLLSGLNGTAGTDYKFTYYDSSGAETTTPANVYRIRINIELEENDETLQLHYEVFPRNL